MPTTTRKSSKSCVAKTNRPVDRRLDRPFSPALLSRARKLAARYRLVLDPDPRRGFIARAVEYPTVFEHGADVESCVHAIREALAVAIATQLETGESPPKPASLGRRMRQINIRVTDDEKLLLDTAASSRGFRNVSDFLRSAALSLARSA